MKKQTWKSIEGMSKGKIFSVVEVTPTEVIYRSQETGRIYSKPRKEFEKYMKRVHEYWSKTNKDYKRKKNDRDFC